MAKTLARTCVAAAALWLACAVQADVRLPALFSDHMVLQRGRPAPVWGWADPSQEVTVSIAGQTRRAVADEDGRWRVEFEGLDAEGPQTLTVTGDNEIVVNDVLLGEVWLCAGQSNMEMGVSISDNAAEERAAANYPEIRMFRVAHSAAAEPLDACEGQWVVCSTVTVLRFSAVAYFFGRDIHEAIGGPIGLIDSSWGGTLAEVWTSLDALETIEHFRPIVERLRNDVDPPWDEEAVMAQYEARLAEWEKAAEQARAQGEPVPRRPREPVHPRLTKNVPGNLFNGMVNPLIPYAIRGAIWYQGESNALRPYASLYGEQLETLIGDWRSRWGYDFPFAWVQLPEYEPRTDVGVRNWSVVREEMVKALRVPNTGMAVTLGLGDPDDVHPKAKQGVGRRLALWALAEVYGQDMVYRSPLYAGHEARGGEIVVAFDHVGDGLVFEGGEAKGFEIAGRDRRFRGAVARIEGDRVIVSSPQAPRPVAARYAWAANPEWSLVNSAGLPASPFRTDAWELDPPPPERADVPEARAGLRDGQAPVLDGLLDDPFWDGLPVYELRDARSGERPEAPTTFKAAWADGAIYFGVMCREPDMANLEITATTDGETAIWQGDCIEILIETQEHSYYQIGVSPAGAVVDLDRSEGLQYLWASGAEATARKGEDHWSVEIRIPLPPEEETDILRGMRGARPTREEPWFFNVCRQRQPGGAGEASHFAAPEARSFHDVERFGKLRVE